MLSSALDDSFDLDAVRAASRRARQIVLATQIPPLAPWLRPDPNPFPHFNLFPRLTRWLH